MEERRERKRYLRGSDEWLREDGLVRVEAVELSEISVECEGENIEYI